MGAFFLDSSALVKRYGREIGSAWMKSIADPVTRNHIYIASITGAEVVAAISRKRHGGILPISDAAVYLADFHYDFINQYRLIDIDSLLIARAMLLADRHALRGYDAVQLAAALIVNDRRLARGWPAVTLVSSDAELNAAAAVEGLAVEDPDTHS